MMKARIASLLLPRSGRKAFVVALVVWNPLLALAIALVSGGATELGARWLVGLAIGETVALQCFGGAQVVRWLEVGLHRLRGREAPQHDLRGSFVVSALLLPLALPLAFRVGGWAAVLVGETFRSPDWRSYRLGIAFGVVALLLLVLQRSHVDARENARAAQDRIRELEASRLRAQLAALTAEMNPHLLFNALNTVASLIHRDPDRAEEVVLELSDLYRGVLRSSGAEAHALADELALCRAYLKIEEARFSDRLRVEVDVDRDVAVESVRVPILLLQPFVENAVKHGIAPLARRGLVSIRVRTDAECLVVRIADDGVGLGRSVHRGSGTAVANCRKRLALTYGDRASLTIDEVPSGGTEVTVRMPLSSSSKELTGT